MSFELGKITSDKLKVAALYNYRYKKGIHVLATEAGMYSADILAYSQDKDKLIEVEIKTNKADLLADFKKPKHDDYLGLYKKNKKHVASFPKYIPNNFSFLVPDHLEEYAVNAVDGLPYGVMVFDTTEIKVWRRNFNVASYRWADKISVSKRAKKLHSNPIHPVVVEDIIRRMGSELCREKCKAVFNA